MSEAKPRLVWVAEHDDDSDYLSVMERLDTQGIYEGVTVCRLHDEAAADLIADAGTVFNTTGLTPSQLVERVKELEEALSKLAKSYERVMQLGAPPPDALKAARAALYKARPNTAEGDPGRCMGTRCTANAANGYAHSRECIDEAGEAQGWKPTAEDYAKCGPSAAKEPSP